MSSQSTGSNAEEPVYGHYQPHWDRDLARGKQGELFVDDIVKAVCNQRVEIKRDAWWPISGRLYVETQCMRHGKWVASGISTTQALVYVFVAGPHDYMIAVKTEHLRRAAAFAVARDPRNGQAAETNGTHPTKGVYVYWHDIVQSRDKSLDEHK